MSIHQRRRTTRTSKSRSGSFFAAAAGAGDAFIIMVVAVLLSLLSTTTTTTTFNKVCALPNPFEGDGIDLADTTTTATTSDILSNIDDNNSINKEEEQQVKESNSSSSLSIRLVDDQTGITPITTLLTNRPTSVYVDGNWWWQHQQPESSLSQDQQRRPISFVCTTYVDGVVTTNGTMTFTSTESLLAFYRGSSSIGGDGEQAVGARAAGIGRIDSSSSSSSLYCGSITSKTTMGTSTIRVEIQRHQGGSALASVSASVSAPTTTTATTTTREVRSYNSWVVSIPIVIPWFLMLGTNTPLELSLFVGAFVGSCILQGSFVQGFIRMFDTHLLTAASNPSHVAL